MARWLGEPAVLPEAPGSQLYNPSSREYPPLMCEHVCAPGTYVHIWCAYMQNTGNTHKIKFGSLLFVCLFFVGFFWGGETGFLSPGCPRTNSLCRSGWPQTHRYPPASASCVLGLKACITAAQQRFQNI